MRHPFAVIPWSQVLYLLELRLQIRVLIYLLLFIEGVSTVTDLLLLVLILTIILEFLYLLTFLLCIEGRKLRIGVLCFLGSLFLLELRSLGHFEMRMLGLIEKCRLLPLDPLLVSMERKRRHSTRCATSHRMSDGGWMGLPVLVLLVLSIYEFKIYVVVNTWLPHIVSRVSQIISLRSLGSVISFIRAGYFQSLEGVNRKGIVLKLGSDFGIH